MHYIYILVIEFINLFIYAIITNFQIIRKHMKIYLITSRCYCMGELMNMKIVKILAICLLISTIGFAGDMPPEKDPANKPLEQSNLPEDPFDIEGPVDQGEGEPVTDIEFELDDLGSHGTPEETDVDLDDLPGYTESCEDPKVGYYCWPAFYGYFDFN